jgi:WD40 repeat protein
MTKYNFWLLFALFLTQTLVAQKAELVLPTAYSQPVEALAFSPDNKLLITIGNDEPLRIWDVATQRLYKSLPLPALHVSFTHDSKQAVLACGASVVVLDLQKMEVTQQIPTVNEVYFNRVAIAPKGNLILLAGSKDKSIFIHQLQLKTGELQQLAVLEQENESATWDCMDFTADGKKMLVSTYEIGGVLYNLEPFSETKRYGKDANIIGMASDGNLLSLKEGYNGEMAGGSYQLLDTATLATKEKFDVTDGDHWIMMGAYRHQFVGQTNAVLVHDEGDVWHLDPVSKKVTVLFKNPSKYEDNFKRIAISPDGKLLAIGKSSPVILSLDGSNAQLMGTLSSPLMWMGDLVTSSANNEIAVSDIGDRAKVIDLSKVGFNLQTYDAKASGGIIALSPNGKYLLAGSDNPGLGWQYTLDKPKNVPSICHYPDEANIEDMVYAPDGKTIALHQMKGLTLVNAATGKVSFSTEKTGKYNPPRNKALVAFSPDSRNAVYLQLKQNPRKPDAYEPEAHVICIDVATGKIVWDQVYAAAGFHYTPDGTTIIAYDETKIANRQNRVFEINAQTGAIMQRWNLRPQLSGLAFAVSPDGKTILNNNNQGGIDVYDVATQSHVTSITGHNLGVKNIQFLKNPRYAVSIGYDNTIRYYDLQNRTQIAKMVLFSKSDDWAVFADDGRFDASKGALKSLYYVKGKEFIPLESLPKSNFTPNLLQSLLESAAPTLATIIESDFQSPPTIKIQHVKTKYRNRRVKENVQRIKIFAKSITLTIEAESKASAIAEIRLYHNGKLLNTDSRSLNVANDMPASKDGHKQSQKITINLVAGDNIFRAVALNAQRTESAPAELIVRY